MWNAEVGDKVRCFGCPRPTASALSSRSRSLTSAFPSPAGEGGDILVTSAPWCHPTPPIRHQSRAVPEMPLDQAICTSRRRHPATSGRYSASPTLIQPARGALSVTYGSRFVPRFCSQTRIRVPEAKADLLSRVLTLSSSAFAVAEDDQQSSAALFQLAR
jgi:hypothetical protein